MPSVCNELRVWGHGDSGGVDVDDRWAGSIVVHEDGDPGIVSGGDAERIEISFASGAKWLFHRDQCVGQTSAFAYLPSGTPNVEGRGLLDPKTVNSRVGFLSQCAALIDVNLESDAKKQWGAADCVEWFPRAALDVLIERRGYFRDVALRDQLRREVESLLRGLRISEADSLYKLKCERWWPRDAYEILRRRPLFAAEFVRRYQFDSLESLDDMWRQDPVGSELSADDLAVLKLAKIQERLVSIGMVLDDDQTFACARPEWNRLIRARAGSGKTRTLAAFASLVIRDEGLAPDQVLTLAFNNKAAKEIGNRIRELGGVSAYGNARTFHSLAYRLAGHTGRKLVFDDGHVSPSRRKQSQFMQRVVHNIANPAFKEKLYEFFRHELEQLDRLGVGLQPARYFAFRRALNQYTLGGENVKSSGEKFIADFLFEHGISYVYEGVWSWDKADRLQGITYRPDFSLSVEGRDYIIEHWAIDPADAKADVPAWWETTTIDYRAQIGDKRAFWRDKGVPLIETHAGMLSAGRVEFEDKLKTCLERCGIRCTKLDHETLIRRCVESPSTISRMAELFLQFVSRAKKRGWTVERAAEQISRMPDTEPRNRTFHELAIGAYAEYERLLSEERAMDFDDLLIVAEQKVREHGSAIQIGIDRDRSIPISELRWILLDEFQDFSELYFRLVRAIIESNPAIRIVAVGDDWQAINGFAGAQLRFFDRFDECFSPAGEAVLATNYRSGARIVDGGNAVMDGFGSPAMPHGKSAGVIDIVHADKVWISDEELPRYRDPNGAPSGSAPAKGTFELAKALKACADFIVGSSYVVGGQRWLQPVRVLARTKNVYGLTLPEFGTRLKRVLSLHPGLVDLQNRPEIDVQTVHSTKGSEADTVIVLQATVRQFPKLHADNQLFGPFGVTAADIFAEEQRLFYVAVTRAKRRLLILSDSRGESIFIDAVRKPGMGARSEVLSGRGELSSGLAKMIRENLRESETG